jgi:hypothetical protein
VSVGLADDEFTDEFILDTQRDVESRAAACMTERGFDFVARPAELTVYVGVPFQSFSIEFAKQYGFGLSSPPQIEAPDVTDPNRDAYERLTVAGKEAWNSAEVRCYEDAQLDSYEETGRAAVDAIEDDAYRAAMADPEVVSAWQMWNRCVEREGFATVSTDYWSLADEMQSRWEALDPTSGQAVAAYRTEEFGTATAAAMCAVPVWPVLTEARLRALERLAPDLAAAVAEIRS